MLLGCHADIGNNQRGLGSTLHLDGVVTVDIGSNTIRCTLLKDCRTNQRFVVISRHDCTLDAKALRQGSLDGQYNQRDKQ